MQLQWINFLYSLLLGAGFGLLYDILRILRVFAGVPYATAAARTLPDVRRLPLRGLAPRRSPRYLRPFRTLWVFFGDVFFGIACGAGMAIFYYCANDGVLRLYALFGATVGFVLYYVTVGRLVLNLSAYVAFGLRAALCTLLWAFLWPLKWMLLWPIRKIGAGILRILLIFRGRCAILSLRRYTNRAIKRRLLHAARGYLS